jgi:hypothetical protein
MVTATTPLAIAEELKLLGSRISRQIVLGVAEDDDAR